MLYKYIYQPMRYLFGFFKYLRTVGFIESILVFVMHCITVDTVYKNLLVCHEKFIEIL